ncbi:general stress protein [Bacillus sp. FJAT-18017]|jgi:uncharacterized protein YoxC|uniref:DUF948 domain-containing protein n=1 Tax=unclassified Bacillus (in: firmicutes) TaxID=185979 RepID=UPI0005C46EE4|nr:MULTISPECIES: DUF948 domain-containing protein [unclassified Bacillus (in: firmicutes)]ALC89643.1 general stress protein [Bacillus sp. FJAT-18017]
MEVILYLSVAVIAIAFFVLVIYLSKTLKSLQITLESVSKTLVGLERQLDGVTKETAVLLHKTNALADDIHRKSESLNTVVEAVKNVGTSVNKFNQSVQTIVGSVDKQIDQNKDKISQIVQWSNVLIELKDKWNARKQAAATASVKRELLEPQTDRGNLQ